jgi:LPXTG-motif cell wall-anchored protein
MQFMRKYYGFFIVLILSFWAIKPLFIPGFFPIHDNTQIARVYEMGKVLMNGVFPVRVVPDLGYGFGYPIFNFYAPLAYYMGATFLFFGFDALAATKIMMALGVILAGVFMYLLARKFFGELGGIVSGLFYTYIPYHAVDIYIRGDVAEFWAYAFIPLAFLGIYKRNLLLGVVGLAGLILSHNLTAMMVMPFLLISALLSIFSSSKNKRKSTLYLLLTIGLIGLGISAFYWIPALFEMRYTNVLSQVGGGADFRDHFVCIGQIWDSPWGFGGSASGCIDGLSLKIGKLHVLTSIVAFIFALFINKTRKSKEGKIIIFSFLGLLLSIFFMLEISKPVWEAIPVMAFFQYPWRFLIMTSFFSSLLAGSLFFLLKQYKIKSYLLTLLLIFLLLFFNLKLFIPQTILPVTSKDFVSEYALKWTASKISDEFLPPDFKKPKDANGVYKGQSNIMVPQTSLENTSNAVSLFSLLALIIGIILIRRKKKYE